MDYDQVASTTIGLSASPQTVTRFTAPCLLVDHADIPLDRRYRTVTKASYATTLTASTDAYNWCAALWGQQNNPATAYIGRWASAATAVQVVCPSATSVASVYAALTSTGQFAITEVGESAEEINPDFTGDTTMADVCASIQTAMSGVVASYTCALDALDRVVITSDNTGTSAALASIGTPLAGTDLTGALYLGTDSFSVAGLDIEGFGAAQAAIRAKTATPKIWHTRGGSIAQEVAFSTANNSVDAMFIRPEYNKVAKGALTTDVSYQVEALSHQQSYSIYTEHSVANGAATDHHPDAAITGEVLQELEGSTNLAHVPLSGCSESGLDPDGTTVIALTDDERLALEAKGCDYLIDPAGSVTCANGLAHGGNEVRIMIGKLWGANRISADAYAYLLAQSVVTFSDIDINAFEMIIRDTCDILVERKVLDSGYELVMPAASSYSTTTKATHIMAMADLSDMTVQVGVNRVTIDFNWLV